MLAAKPRRPLRHSALNPRGGGLLSRLPNPTDGLKYPLEFTDSMEGVCGAERTGRKNGIRKTRQIQVLPAAAAGHAGRALRADGAVLPGSFGVIAGLPRATRVCGKSLVHARRGRSECETIRGGHHGISRCPAVFPRRLFLSTEFGRGPHRIEAYGRGVGLPAQSLGPGTRKWRR